MMFKIMMMVRMLEKEKNRLAGWKARLLSLNLFRPVKILEEGHGHPSKLGWRFFMERDRANGGFCILYLL